MPSAAAQPTFVTATPLRIPYGNKEVAMKLGARYGSAGWYAPPGVEMGPFEERGWLIRDADPRVPPTQAPPTAS
jgi:DNA topoisomerase-3